MGAFLKCPLHAMPCAKSFTWLVFFDSPNNQRKAKVSVAQSCLTLCDPMDCRPPGSSFHGILQARTLEWVAEREVLLLHIQ